MEDDVLKTCALFMGFHSEALNRKEVNLLNSTQLLLLQEKLKEWTPARGWGRSAGSPTP